MGQYALSTRISMDDDCESAHRHIESGACPWCGQTLGDGVVGMATRWKAAAIGAELQKPDASVGYTAISGLLFGWQVAEDLLEVLDAAVRHADRGVSEKAEDALLYGVSQLGVSESRILETCCDEERFELAARLVLLGCAVRLAAERTWWVHRIDHVLWLLEHAPWCRVLRSPWAVVDPTHNAAAFAHAGTRWRAHTQRCSDARVLMNAAMHFRSVDPWYSVSLLHRARTLEPSSSDIARLLFGISGEVAGKSPFDQHRGNPFFPA